MVISLAFIGIYILAVVVGLFFGFGKVLEVVAKGLVGKIVAVFITYTIFGLVLELSFVQSALLTLTTFLGEKGAIGKVLLATRIELVVLAVVLYFAVRFVLKLMVELVSAIMSADNKIMIFINKTLGVALSLAFVTIIVLLVFQILFLTTGTSGAVYQALSQTFLKLDKLYVNNPLNAIVDSFIRRF